MKIVIASHKFNPSHLSHIIAISRVYSKHGYEVYHRVSERYLDLQPEDGLRCITLKELLALNKTDVFIVYAPSLSALIESLLIKIIKNPLVFYFLHEPFTGIRSYITAGFGYLKTLRISMVALVSFFNCKISDTVVLSSAKAYEAATFGKKNLGKYKRVNLLFLDESEYFDLSPPSRKYISYIGTIAEDHAFNEFVNLVYEGVINKRVNGEKFLIASKSTIPKHLLYKVNHCRNLGYLTVASGAPMTNLEINTYYANSFAVWNAYKRSMQSGVLPKSYMFGSPIINCESNISEYFVDKIHGVSIGGSYNLEAFLEAIVMIKFNFDELSANCRKNYLYNFDVSSQSEKILSLLGGNHEQY
jgi:hypothetical protein